jgi:hypothetical protein
MGPLDVLAFPRRLSLRPGKERKKSALGVFDCKLQHNYYAVKQLGLEKMTIIQSSV